MEKIILERAPDLHICITANTNMPAEIKLKTIFELRPSDIHPDNNNKTGLITGTAGHHRTEVLVPCFYTLLWQDSDVHTGLILGMLPANDKTSLQSNPISHWLGANL